MLYANKTTIERNGIRQLFDSFSDKGIIFVSAPAGYGKTVAIKQWLSGKKCSKAILSLDEYDNILLGFCERFCAALCACQPQNSALCEMVSRPAFSGAPSEFTLRAMETLSKRKRAVLAIDDLHYLQDANVIKLLIRLTKAMPKAIQLVLISRNNPPKEFCDILAGQSHALVGANDLSFSSNDITQLYKKCGKLISPEQSNDILHFTGGWPIGVSSLLISGGKPSDNVLEYLDDYILPNIWGRLDFKTREFMLCTAMAKELPPSLCNTLAKISDSESVLNGLMNAGTFVSSTADGVFQYHHLFRSFLRKKVKLRGKVFLYDLLEMEGNWHLSARNFYSAAECFIQCQSVQGIVKCFDMLEFTDRRDFIINRMLPIIKSHLIQTAAQKYPSLYYLMAWAAYAEGRDKDMIVYMDSYYSRYAEIAQRDPAHAHNVIYMRIFDFRSSLIQIIMEAAQFPAIQGVSGVQGSITMNMPIFHRGIRDFSELATVDLAAFFAGEGGKTGWMFGEEWGIIKGCCIAGMLYEQGRLESARACAHSTVNEIKAHYSSELKFCAMSLLIYIMQAQGDLSDIVQELQKLDDMIEADRAYYLTRNLKALTVRLKLPGSNSAQAWIRDHAAATGEGAHIHDIYCSFTTARAYLELGDLEQAIILLTKLIDLARRFNRPLDIIEGQILLAISYWKNSPGFHSKAISALSEAIAIARPYDFTQPFVNEQENLSDLLLRLKGDAQLGGDENGAANSFIEKLLASISYEAQTTDDAKEMGHVIAFTARQKAVMSLLNEGKSFNEIAGMLNIKLSTVKSHIALIYDKLNASSKIDAIAKIRIMGLVD